MAALTPFPIASLTGQLKPDASNCPLPQGKWYSASATGDGLSFDIPAGLLDEKGYLTADLLLDGDRLAVFALSLYEGDSAKAKAKDKDNPPRIFRFAFSLLPQCSGRLRMPLRATNQNQWSFEREGACLKLMASGDRVDPAKITRATITLTRKSDQPVRVAIAPLAYSSAQPPAMDQPILPKGKLLDETGQSTLRNWPARTKSAEECSARLKQQLADAPRQSWPAGFSAWGGAKDLSIDGIGPATGYFRTYNDGARWWLVDPSGKPFWSAGLDSVRPDVDAAYGLLQSALPPLPDRKGEYAAAFSGRRGSSFNYLVSNFIRAFGKDAWHDHWGDISLSLLRSFGFNTVANWSEWNFASKARFPYVRPLQFHPRQTPLVYRDFPDAFSPLMDSDAEQYARQLEETKTDPALIGYFLMNEPTWGFASETPAAGMLYTHEHSHARDHFATWLAEKYGSDAKLAAGWGIDSLTLAQIATGKWNSARRLPAKSAARADCADFSTLMVERYFQILSRACRKADPNHLNLGARYHTVPPAWALKGMTTFDVFSINCYQERVPPAQLKQIADTVNKPTLIGEYHFGALDVGLPASGIGHVATQADRGKAFRVYTETAAAIPQCVGVHYFILYDQSALGRFDGENYNIGFLDVCNRPYAELASAARLSHERLYAVASGKEKAYVDAPKYLPKLF